MIRGKVFGIAYVSIIIFLSAMPVYGSADLDNIIVYGIGYPPIKAQSKAQALLMARRAALLDAYRNALKASSGENSEPNEDKTFYEKFSGFIRDMKIISEEYLGDGGLKVKTSISLRDVSIFQKGHNKKEGSMGYLPERLNGPERVTVEEWYRIISGVVRFEN
jgi:hypothetical protein